MKRIIRLQEVLANNQIKRNKTNNQTIFKLKH